MNIFVIPSWFPSKDRPVSGTMIKEQTEAFCRFYPDVNIGISNWGQMEERFLLWSKDHVKNISKLLRAKPKPFKTVLAPNLKVYHHYTFTWTSKLLGGNMLGIIKANLSNIKAFEVEHGPIDIIHAHVGYPAGIIAMRVAERLRKPYCLTERMGPFPWAQTADKNGRLADYYKQPYLRTSANIAVSPFQVEALRKQGIDNIMMIPNFIDENFFKPSPDYHPQSEKFTFFTLSYPSPQKGTDILLQAIKGLSEKNKNILFRIGGSSPYIDGYKRMASELGIQQYVAWLGEINRKEALHEYQFCDAFALPSFYESMGIVYIEALACGKPVIATRCGGPESTVTPLNGLLIEKNNVAELIEAMETLIKRRESYDSNSIRADFLARFSTQAIAPKTFNMYQRIISNSLDKAEL
ncbi:glycosyltransferase [Pontibacter flavimaris]|uniref:Glycosyltransferase family 4 protein n=1 Tax=Pontibacter flavimaris TaxID=1797110 RepID=A0A1Q5PA89_9BACT|nr:glycosyltransferase [Pontibacter flavimaris]OKL39156.1 hypothetical protein A3841_04210 [Pontibacter flavimaris]